MLKHIEASRKSFGFVQVLVIGAHPMEGLARHDLNAAYVDLASGHPLKVGLWKILAHDAYDSDGRVVRRRNRKVIERPTQDLFGFASRRFDRIERKRSHRQNRSYIFAFHATAVNRNPAAVSTLNTATCAD